MLKIISTLFAFGAAFVAAYLADVHGNADYSMGYRCGAFVGTFAIVVGLPMVIGLVAKGGTREMIRGIGMIILSVLVSLGHLAHAIEVQKAQAVLTDAELMADQMKAEARKKLANGDYTPDTAQAQTNIAKLQSEVTGDSDEARGTRDTLKLTSELIDKSKASTDIENSCDYSLDAIKTLADLDAQTASFTKLRASEQDVIDYLENFDQHVHDLLEADHLSASYADGFIHGARENGKVDMLTRLWQSKAKLVDDFLARQAYLKKNWSQLQLKGGDVLFVNDSAISDYNGIIHKIQDDAATVTKLQIQAVQ